MTPPFPDDGISLWQLVVSVGGGAAAVLGTASAFVAWLLKRIDSVRTDAEKKIEDIRIANEVSINKLRSDVVSRLDEFSRHYREDRQEAQQWREHVLSQMVTRPELDRVTDRQTNELFERLDVRISPLLHRERDARWPKS